MTIGESPERVFSVSELTRLVRDRLEQGFPHLWVEGEVSNLRAPASGHLYFTLKDHASQIRTVLFRAGASRLRFELREGLQLLVRGRLTVYEPRGEYQLLLDSAEPKGIGALQIRFEQLKEKLAREGLFDDARKRPLPLFPRRVGLVTSLTGAAIQDMLTIIRRRCPIQAILICPVPVQGDDAAPEIAAGIRALSESGRVDVLIVGRGGGSWEDLWCFNEEVVVRAIAESAVPVVSAVGHEIDFTLADFAADYRAPTPSAAAEAVAPVLDDLVNALWDLWARQQRTMQGRLVFLGQQIHGLTGRMPLIGLRIQRQAQGLDEMTGRLTGAFRQTLWRLRGRVVASHHAVGISNPMARVRSVTVLVRQLVTRAEKQMVSLLTLKREMVATRLGKLDSLSPLAILGRGYSIIQTVPQGTIVRRAREVGVGDEVHARLGEGRLLCNVMNVLPDA